MSATANDHDWTRWWLRRVATKGQQYPTLVYLYDRAIDQMVGEPLRYPQELSDAVAQLRQLRHREREPQDYCVFCDDFGDYHP